MGGARNRWLEPLSSGGDRTALAFEGETLTWSALGTAAAAWAAALADAGIARGARVAALGHSAPALIAAMLGTYRLGAVWVPVNPRYAEPEVTHVIRDANAGLVLVDAALEDRLCNVADVRRIRLDEPAPSSTRDLDEALADVSDEEPALLIYTSGTTGRSKGVELSHGAVAAAIGSLTGLWQWRATDVLSLQLPLFHVHGLAIGVHGCLLHTMTARLSARFSAATVVDDVRAGATIFMGVPTMYTRLLEHLEARPADASALQGARLFTAGSAALPAADLERFEALTGHRIVERYGMSETLITLSNPVDGERRAGSVGRPIPGVEIRVVDEHGVAVPDGDPGELQVQTVGMMTGYYGQPAATAKTFDGAWLKTGDLVVREPDGYVRIVGRLSVDIIKSGGFKIGAREIEDVLIGTPGLAEVAVFGVADPTWGERIVAAVVPAPDGPQTAEAWLPVLVERCADQLADYKKPREAVVVDALPRNAMGKVQKVALRRALEAGYPPAQSR